MSAYGFNCLVEHFSIPAQCEHMGLTVWLVISVYLLYVSIWVNMSGLALQYTFSMSAYGVNMSGLAFQYTCSMSANGFNCLVEHFSIPAQCQHMGLTVWLSISVYLLNVSIWV